MKIWFNLILMLSSFAALADNDFCAFELKQVRHCLKTSWQKSQCYRDLLQKYTSDQIYKPVNASLRGLTIDPSCTQLGSYIKVALLKQPQKSQRVFRGTRLRADLRKLKEGDCYSDKGFASTSKSLEVAKRFAGSSCSGETDCKSAVLVMQTSSGRSIKEFSNYVKEEEVLLPPGTAFRLSRRILSTEHSYFFFKEVSASACR